MVLGSGKKIGGQKNKAKRSFALRLRSLIRLLFAIFALLAVTADISAAEEWGNLKARFVYDGMPPERAKIKVDKDREFFKKLDVRDESLIVGEDRGLANVLLYLYAPAGTKIPTHPDYAKSADAKVTLDSRDGAFVPHLLALRTTQTLVVRNSDPIGHNAHYQCLVNQGFNLLLMPGREVEVSLKEPEPFPATVFDGIHPWRNAKLMVLDHPYSAVSDNHGRVVIANLPVGKWTFRVFHEKPGHIKSVDRDGEMVEWPKGKFELEIKSGDNDLGEIKLSPKLFERGK